MKSASQPYGCGQCLPCRFNKRRLWTNRLLLELRSHGDAAFVTLTYSDDFLPKNKSLDPKQLKLWMKRLNKLAGGGLRYYNVGEYGDQTQRPHYHALIFGLPPNSLSSLGPGRTRNLRNLLGTYILALSKKTQSNMSLDMSQKR